MYSCNHVSFAPIFVFRHFQLSEAELRHFVIVIIGQFNSRQTGSRRLCF